MDSDILNYHINLSSSLEQEFRMRIFKESVQEMKPEEARSLLIEASKLLMIKDNIIKELIQQDVTQ